MPKSTLLSWSYLFGLSVTRSYYILLTNSPHVGIRLSADNWATFQDTNSSFSGTVPVATGSSQVEVWKFKTPEFNLDESTPYFHFAIFYNNLDTGEWFWDNNFGQDYTLNKAD